MSQTSAYPPGTYQGDPRAPWNQSGEGIEISELENTRAALIDAKESLRGLKAEIGLHEFDELVTVGWNQIGIITYLSEIIDNLSRKIREEEDGE